MSVSKERVHESLVYFALRDFPEFRSNVLRADTRGHNATTLKGLGKYDNVCIHPN